MQAREVMEHFREIGHWLVEDGRLPARVSPVDLGWPGPDQFLYGDPEAQVHGIAVAWIATNAAVRLAAARGLNLFISHEPAFYQAQEYDQSPVGRRLIKEKKELLQELGVTLARCHDTWDRLPGIGIVDTWAALFGFQTEARPLLSYYKVCLTEDWTVQDIARRVLDRVRPFGQDTVLVYGDFEKRIRRMVVGTGAVTFLADMVKLRPDLFLAADDGCRWAATLFALDLGIPLLVVNHSTAEKPGMVAMSSYLRDKFPQVPVEYLDVEFPYRSVH